MHTVQLFHVCLQSRVHQWHWLSWNQVKQLLHPVVIFNPHWPACSATTPHGPGGSHHAVGECVPVHHDCSITNRAWWPVSFVQILQLVIELVITITAVTNCHFILVTCHEYMQVRRCRRCLRISEALCTSYNDIQKYIISSKSHHKSPHWSGSLEKWKSKYKLVGFEYVCVWWEEGRLFRIDWI